MKRFKIPFLYLLSFVASVLPVALYFFANADRYFVTVSDRVRLSVGIVCLCVIVLLKAMGKLKMPSRAVLFAFVMVMCYLLERVLDDLIIFSFLALVGEILDIGCQYLIRREREKKLVEKTAQATTAQITKILNGRV